MVIIITGASHTGKTLLSQKLIEKIYYPCFSIDHLKMGLIRSNYIDVTQYEDEKITEILWPIIREMIKTAIENKQNLIIEGFYVPLNWQESFSEYELENIKSIVLVMTKEYIEDNFKKIKKYSNVIENRIEDDVEIKSLIFDNEFFLKNIDRISEDFILIEDEYNEEDILQKALNILYLPNFN